MTQHLKFLAFETSTEMMSVALSHGDQTWHLHTTGGPNASAQLIPSIHQLLAQAQLQLTDLTALVIGQGPGSFTGLRTACSVAQGLALALPASRLHDGQRAWARSPTRLVLNALRSIPELVWAALLLISAGLGPFAGTLALALHTTGVLGRLFAEAIENAPPGPGDALRAQGVGNGRVFLYATLPQVLPQLMSYTLYRWENNIRAAAVLGVVGAGGLGQLLAFHMGLFQMGKTATILGAMLLMVALVDAASHGARRVLTR